MEKIQNNIYLLTQYQNRGYDTYDSIVVIAETEREAVEIHPYGSSLEEESKNSWNGWADNSKHIKCTLIGVAGNDQEKGVVLASFNAG